jgi:hypothetical protein
MARGFGGAFGSVVLPVGIGVGKAAVNRFDEDPRAIMRDAEDPSVNPIEVLTRAKLRSKSGSLLRAAETAIANRPATGLASLFE